MARGKRSRKLKPALAQAQSLVGAQPSVLSSFSDHEPTRNKKELVVKVWDFFKYDFVPADPYAGHVYCLAWNRFTNLFNEDAQPDPMGYDDTLNRIKSVTLWCMSPFEPILYKIGTDKRKTVLPLVLAGVPTEETADDKGIGVIGQSSTAVHVDQRQAWVKCGHWNWHSLFGNTQLEPLAATDSSGNFPTYTQLLRVSVIDATTGSTIAGTTDDDGHTGLTFRVCIEVEAPIMLTPQPGRVYAYADHFSGAQSSPSVWTQDTSPVQYELRKLQDAI